MGRFFLLFALIATTLCITVKVEADDSLATNRKLNFNPDWRFIKEDIPGAKDAGFDDSTWTSVSCPHTYNDIDTFDDFSPPAHRGETNQFGGRTWYRKSFDVPESFKGKKVYIEFEAVRQFAEVYLNGHLLGISRTGFLPFGFDLTPHLKPGEKNVLAVMCDNRFMKDETATDGGGRLAQHSAKVNAAIPEELDKIQADQIPWNNPHWHPAHGGIFRNVYLHVVDPLHISLPLYSFLQTVGPYVYTTGVSEKSATVNLQLTIENGRSTGEQLEVVAEILDREGKPIAKLKPMLITKNPLRIDAGKSGAFDFGATIANPHRWEPAYPYLYRLACSIRISGREIDRCEVPFGIHTTRFDAESGFYINGHHEKLHGWGQKPTDEWPGLGAAQPDWLHYFTLAQMKQAGGNWVRWGHCAGGPAQIAAGDQLGVMAEQPGVDGESDTRGAAWQIRKAAFRDCLVYYRNSPSIMIWEGGNQKVSREHVQELRDIIMQFDAHGNRAFAFRRSDPVVAQFENVHIGTEGGRELKQLPVIEGEYDREESPRRVWDDFSPPNFGYPEAKGMTYQLTSEQFAVNQVEKWVKSFGPADHCGGANWIFSDSTSGGRVPAEVARAGGEVDGARLPKEAYYVCQTMFRDDPQAHIIGHWSYPAGTKKTVYVVANGDEVELQVNGKSVGRAKPVNRYLFTFADVNFESGEIKAISYLEQRPIATDSRKTAGAPAKLKLTAITGTGGLRASGSDVALIDAQVVDANGERCPTFQGRIDFTCTGPAIWRGGYNSGKANSTNNLYLDLECGINRVAVRSTRESGKIIVEGKVQGLPPATIEIASTAISVDDGMSSELPALPPQGALSLPKASDPRLNLATATTRPALADGKLMKGFNYTGPSADCAVKPLWRDTDPIYTDRSSFTVKDLPAAFKDKSAEYVLIPCNDTTYSALDLIQFTAGANVDIYIAHDNRLAIPKWLSGEYEGTKETVTLGDAKMTLFKRSVNKDSSLTLGSNADQPSSPQNLMYIVVAVPK